MVYFSYILMTLLGLSGVFLIGLILLQRGRGGGLAGAFGGMGGQSAFGTKAGDVFTRITIGVASAWILLCAGSVLALHFSTNTRSDPGNFKVDKGGDATKKAQPKDDLGDPNTEDPIKDAGETPAVDPSKKDDAKKEGPGKGNTGKDNTEKPAKADEKASDDHKKVDEPAPAKPEDAKPGDEAKPKDEPNPKEDAKPDDGDKKPGEEKTENKPEPKSE